MGATLLPGPDPMTEPTPPPRRPLATFLRAGHADTPASDPPADAPAPLHEPAQATPPDPAAVAAITVGKDWTQTIAVFDPPEDEREDRAPAQREDVPAAETIAIATADALGPDRDAFADADADAAGIQQPHASMADAGQTAPGTARSTGAPSFMRLPVARLRTPRWQWGVLAALVVVLLVQIAVADRARLAADAGSRPWIAGVCTVLRCTLPAWQEPAAFSMISRDVRPVPGQPGALQVQASFRNDARWAQAWPSLRLSLSDADGRVIGTGVFAPRDYLDRSLDANSVLEPGQSAQIAFRVREPAASTVAFTFEFL
ncbi:hypothetical protein D3C87_197930 [compost metagenome]